MKRIFLLMLGCSLMGVPAGAEALSPAWELSGLEAPESAYYDAASKLLFLSNVSGSPGEKDGRGWISKADAAGMMLEAQWASGLNAPKGMRSHKGRLYVADIDEVAEIDIQTGKLVRKTSIPGAQMLNDVVVDVRGNVYVSDTLGSRIYMLDPQGKVSVFAEGPELESPNGLLLYRGRLLVAAWGLAAPDWSTKAPGRLLAVDLKTRKVQALTEPLGNLDGLERSIDGQWLVSDWAAGKVFRVSQEGKATLLLEGHAGSADLGYVPQDNLLVVPCMKENRVVAYTLPGAEGSAGSKGP